jgi:hypothetical protein
MRRTLAGILFFTLLTPSLALAQAKGFVESVGFENNYRPDCWTSMVINLTPETSESGTYLIQVHQEDLDRDRPIFTRTITLTGASEGGGAKQQKFRMYFIPQPTDGGLPDARDAGSNLKDLQDRLKVTLCTASGKWICDLPITATVMNADPKLGAWDVRRGNKLILCVGNGSTKPAYRDNTTASQLLGVMEDVTMVTVQPRDLPENVIGYDAIDAIVWFNADPAELRAGGDERFRAVQEYVRRGGRLVICQHSDWQRTLEFGELLPVTIDAMRDKNELEPLRSLAQIKNRTVERAADEIDPWQRIRGPFKIAHAQANVGTLVDEWVFWDAAKKDFSPYIARKPYGMGSVTWVAQDLGDPYITSRTKTGWPEVWDRVFDWKNDPYAVPPKGDDRAVQFYGPGSGVDIGFSLTRGMDLDSKTAWLVTLAIVFFIAYWLLAGPGVFAYLVGKRKTELSWFMFGASAVAATLVTLLIVQLVLRGPPIMKHFSVIKVAPNQPAVVTSRIGLYIPRDGYERIELKDATANNVSTISAFPWNPTFGLKAPDMQGPEYVVPVVEAATSDLPHVRVPYSSTLKKFQATWVGKVEGAVEGSARLVEEGTIEGTLTNGTGVRLKNIYLAFKSPLGTEWSDWVLYIPSWDAGVTIDLNTAFNKPDDPAKAFPNIGSTAPEEGKRVKGLIARQWDQYWYKPMRGTNMLGSEGTRDDFNDRIRRSLPMLSLFDRLPTVRNEASKNDRFELLRRGGRQLDLSGALAAGALIVLAEADDAVKLPFPLYVEGSRIDGSGINFYQFVLPLDHSKLAATTRPVADFEGQ